MDDVRSVPQNALTRSGRSRDEVNFSADSSDEPEQIGPIGARVLDDLAAGRREALSRLARAHRTADRKDQP